MPSLTATFPWLQRPVIANAPMGGIAGPKLAIAVIRAGGFGLMGMDATASTLTSSLDEVESALFNGPIAQYQLDYLPVGVGFLCTFVNLESVVDRLNARKGPPPAVVWLFAADEPSVEIYTKWATTLRKLYEGRQERVPQVWIQVGGSATVALELALSGAKPDAVIMQGIDAGGHGEERGASIVSLVPQTTALFAKAASENNVEMPHILASGGVVNSQGVLAALSLGAEGAVLGTRFLAAPETDIHLAYRERILSAGDGAVSTIRAKVFDELRGPNVWPKLYDGRALVSRSWRELHEEGQSIEAIRVGHAEAVKKYDGGFSLDTDRAAIWAGTGVGLVNKEQSATEIVNEVRSGVLALAEAVKQGLSSTSKL